MKTPPLGFSSVFLCFFGRGNGRTRPRGGKLFFFAPPLYKFPTEGKNRVTFSERIVTMENKNQPKKEKNRVKANRILFVTAAAVLCLGAILTGVLLSLQQDDILPVGDVPAASVPNDQDNEPPVVDTSAILPEFVSPAVGLVTKRHDLDTLVFSQTNDDWRVHRGIDISTALGASVMAAADGTVTEILDDPLLGKTVKISHNGEGVTVYANLSAELAEGITVGASVTCGQVIGCVGETAISEMADEPHLHFEMTVAGVSVDPMDYISESSKAASLSADTAYEG